MKIEKIADKKNKDKYYIFFIGKFSNFFFFLFFSIHYNYLFINFSNSKIRSGPNEIKNDDAGYIDWSHIFNVG